VVQQANQQYYYGTGKRKTAIARVRLYPGDTTQDQVNGKPLEEAIPWGIWRQQTQEPLRVTNLRDRFTIRAKVHGGGVSAQADAIRHGIAWALIAYDETLKPELRRHGFLTRDNRIKESKKYGLKRARRAPQYTKR
jgi:small subunit ribosomal protein S9